MLVRHLSYFVTLAREKHFARAAERCNITQPTLSAALRKLEEDLNTPLILRGRRFMGLTAEGEKLLAWGRHFADYDGLRSDLSGEKERLAGTIRIGVVPAAAPATIVLTTRLCSVHPNVRIEIRAMSSRAIQQELLAFNLDGGLTYLDNEPLEHVAALPLYQERYMFVAPSSHPFAGRKTIAWAQAAADERLCLLSEDMQNRRVIDRIAASVGITIQPPVASNSFVNIAAHLRRYNWSSIIPHLFVELFEMDTDLVVLDLVDPVHRQPVGLVLSDREPRSPFANALVAAMVNIDFESEWARLRDDRLRR